jgi:hypothetical protein
VIAITLCRDSAAGVEQIAWLAKQTPTRRRVTPDSGRTERRKEHMKRTIILAATIAAFGAITVGPLAAKSGGTRMGSSNGQSGPVGKVDAKPFKFKLIRCHKYARGNGHGGINWETVCF